MEPQEDPDLVPSSEYSHLILRTPCQGRYSYHPHSTDEKTEAEMRCAAWVTKLKWGAVEPGHSAPRARALSGINQVAWPCLAQQEPSTCGCSQFHTFLYVYGRKRKRCKRAPQEKSSRGPHPLLTHSVGQRHLCSHLQPSPEMKDGRHPVSGSRTASCQLAVAGGENASDF